MILLALGRRVCLGGDQVHHGQDPGQAIGELGVGRDGVGDLRRGDLGSGAHQALGHGGLWHQEGPGDRGHLQAGQGTKGQGDLGLAAKRRMAAGEGQAQQVVS